MESTRRRRLPGLSLVLGALLTVAFYAVVMLPNFENSIVRRYTTGHLIEYVTIALVMTALMDLMGKCFGLVREKLALRADWLPEDAEPVPASQAESLIHMVQARDGMASTYIAIRLRNALKDVLQRRSADQLDAHLKYLAELDADRSHGGYAMVRVIAWMVPILGFLGTVIGITLAIANITPSQLETSLPQVTSGLAVAFDTTALALSLSIVLMLIMAMVEKAEQNILEEVEARTHAELAYRFQPGDAASAPYLNYLRSAGDSVIAHTRSLVETQSDVWAGTIAELQGRYQQTNQALEERLHRTLSMWQSQWEMQTKALDQTSGRMYALQQEMGRVTETLLKVVEGEGQLVNSQKRLTENLRAIQETGAFEEALSSLTAAIHLMTIRKKPSDYSDAA